MTTWDMFYSLVRPHVQNCPISYVDAALRASAREFCEKTQIWNQEAICGDLLVGEQVYKYNFHNDGISIVHPIECIMRQVIPNESEDVPPQIIDHHAYPVNLRDLSRYQRDWRLVDGEWPSRFYMKDSNTIVFTSRPTEDHWGSIHLLCAVKPSHTAEGVADFLYEDWAETIAYGALRRLLAMPSRVWANLQMVSYFERLFREGISRARERVIKSYTKQTIFMVPKSFS